MPTVSFTRNMQRHVAASSVEAAGGTVREVLDRAFDGNDALRACVLDDQGAVRRHMVIFVDGNPIHDRTKLTDAVQPNSEIHIMQALSGG